jgi:outer membrane biosynthesis protein TonB
MIATPSIRLRLNEERQYLVLGLISSLGLHLAFLGVWLSLGALLLAVNRTTLEELAAAQERARQAEDNTPLMFVEVLPDQATVEPPKTAEFYSTANSQAANPDAEVETGVPKIDGPQDKVMRTVENLQPRVETLQPTPQAPPEELAAEPVPVGKSTPEKASDLAFVRPAPANEKAERKRPTRLSEVKTQPTLLAGQRMRQDGGVRRRGQVSLDAKATPFGDYDAAIIASIQQRWYDILDEGASSTRSGKVGIEFRLHYDGRITDLRVVEQDVGELLTLFCRRAISDPAPFARWPNEMRQMVGRDYRDVRFTFYYL